MTKTQQMSLINIKLHDLLKKLIQGLIWVSNNECPLCWEVVIKIWDYLNSYICFPCSWWTHNQCQAWLHSSANSLYLCWCEWNCIPIWRRWKYEKSEANIGIWLFCSAVHVIFWPKSVINTLSHKDSLEIYITYLCSFISSTTELFYSCFPFRFSRSLISFVMYK